VDYETVINSAPVLPPIQHSPDDLYVLYTAHDRMPKVCWRQHDIFMTSFAGEIYDRRAHGSLDEIVTRLAWPGTKLMILPPLIHGAAQWSVMTASRWADGRLPSSSIHLDADDVVRTIERRK